MCEFRRTQSNLEGHGQEDTLTEQIAGAGTHADHQSVNHRTNCDSPEYARMWRRRPWTRQRLNESCNIAYNDAQVESHVSRSRLPFSKSTLTVRGSVGKSRMSYTLMTKPKGTLLAVALFVGILPPSAILDQEPNGVCPSARMGDAETLVV